MHDEPPHDAVGLPSWRRIALSSGLEGPVLEVIYKEKWGERWGL